MSDPPPADPDPSISPTPVISYATPAPSNPAAVWSIVTGVLIFVPFLGILTIIFARRGLAAAREGAGREQMARMGFILGVMNLFFTLIGLATLPPALIKARRAAMQVQCMSNLRQLAQVQMIYAAASGGVPPQSFDDLVTATAVFARPGSLSRLFTCPACAGDAAKPPATIGKTQNSSYIFPKPPPALNRLKNAARTVMAYEPLTNHDGRGSAFLFWDGHVQWLTASDAAKVIAELTAGQNPPPSIR